jgi:hypothetical protein
MSRSLDWVFTTQEGGSLAARARFSHADMTILAPAWPAKSVFGTEKLCPN